MPSAARQRLPPELWGYNPSSKTSCTGQMPQQSRHEVQAHPGQYDSNSDDFWLKPRATSKRNQIMKSGRKHRTSSKVNTFSSTKRRGSADVISDDQTDSDCSSSGSAIMLSSSSGSENGFTKYSGDTNSFAMDPVDVPHPSQVPLPPVEWLKPSMLIPSPEANVRSLNEMFGILRTASKGL